MTPGQRTEHDLLEDREVPAGAYWGIRTLRACENFPTTGTPISAYPQLVDALAAVKAATARANAELGLLAPEKALAIVEACREIRNGHLHGQFVVDVIQGRAGTSANMNANEVIANRALEILGHAKGEYESLHPNEDVNLSHSTDDAYPTAIKVATINAVIELLAAMSVLREAFTAKAEEFRDVLTRGRNQPEDAVPMTLGQEFSVYAVMLEESRGGLAEAVGPVHEINLGTTAIGMGLNTPIGFAGYAGRHLADITRLPLVTAGNLVEAAQDYGAFVRLSGVLKSIAVKLSMNCGDLRMLSSGPRAELNETNLPAGQAGSRIMPGEANAVVPEVVNRVAFEVIGNDATVTMAAEAGQLQRNVFEPVIFHSLSESISHLRTTCLALAERCVAGITAGTVAMRAAVAHSIGLVTALSPHIGYTAATGIAP